MKIVINRCFGGFGLSEKAILNYASLKGINLFKSSKKFCGSHSFYLVSEDEFEKTLASDKLIGNYKKSNSLVFYDRDIERNDDMLVKTVEDLKEKSSGDYANLQIVEIPNGINWEIKEYDGMESVEETHRSWR